MKKFLSFLKTCLWDPRVVLLLIVAVACFMRLYHLDGPSMWGDEIFAPVMARKPLDYLLRWNWLEDVHPPLYYFFMKGVLALGVTDFALRFPSVVFGVASVYAMYVLAKAWVDEESGLYAAAAMAVYVPHLYISRVVRFYSVTTFLVIVVLILLKLYMERRDDRTLLGIVCSSAALLLCEFTSLMPIIGVYAVLLAIILSGKNVRQTLRTLCTYSLLAFALPFVFLALTTVQRTGFSAVSTIQGALETFLGALGALGNGELSRMAGEPWSPGPLTALSAFGLVVLLWKSRPLLGVLLAMTACSLVVILGIRPGYQLAFWHLFFLVPGVVLAASQGARALVPAGYRVPAALGVCLAGCAIILWTFHGRLYDENAMASIKAMGKAVASEVQPGSAVLIETDSIDCINWYADQYSLENRLKTQSFDARSGSMTLNILLGEDGTIGHLVSPKRPVETWARVVAEKPVGKGRLLQAAVDRQPIVPLDLSGRERDFDAHPARFYGTVYAADKVMLDAYWGGLVIPTVNQAPCGFTYVFENPGKSGDTLIELRLGYRNAGKNNLFRASYRFDGEDPVVLVSSRGPLSGKGHDSPENDAEVSQAIRREAPFTSLKVDVEMVAELVTPKYPTSNLNLTGFKQLKVKARPFGPDLMREETLDPRYLLNGLRGVESEGDRRWRWAVGESNGLSFTLDQDTPMRLTYGFTNPFKDQGYALTVNGVRVAGEDGLDRRDWNDPVQERTVEFTGRKGENSVAFAFAKVNHVNASISETDPSPYSVAFRVLRLESVR